MLSPSLSWSVVSFVGFFFSVTFAFVHNFCFWLLLAFCLDGPECRMQNAQDAAGVYSPV
jgi:hypothetical protein